MRSLGTHCHQAPRPQSSIGFSEESDEKVWAPKVIITDRLKSYRAAMKVLGNQAAQDVGRWKNNRAENSHLPFRRRE